ncbi:MAG: hypothetical protein JO051_03335 [Acidobacteriaceae bacterium]|nr:hypothetical protein [Acidobacteriaceae bacterium]
MLTANWGRTQQDRKPDIATAGEQARQVFRRHSKQWEGDAQAGKPQVLDAGQRFTQQEAEAAYRDAQAARERPQTFATIRWDRWAIY